MPAYQVTEVTMTMSESTIARSMSEGDLNFLEIFGPFLPSVADHNEAEVFSSAYDDDLFELLDRFEDLYSRKSAEEIPVLLRRLADRVQYALDQSAD
jgi:hypothetical protein